MNFTKFMTKYASLSLKAKCTQERRILRYLKSQLYCSSALNKSCADNEENALEKVIYNEVLQKIEKQPEKLQPICLKYLMENHKTKKGDDIKEAPELIHFPYETDNNEPNVREELFSEAVYNFTPSDYKKIQVPKWTSDDYYINFQKLEDPRKWALNECGEIQDQAVDDVFRFGSCDPNQKISSIPCGGCGALLHCNDPTLPGFIPAEIYEVKFQELRGEICQRCHFLRKFDVALGLNVSPTEYINLLSAIKEKEALAIIMIDLLDFPCSIFPGILELIGKNKPIVVVGNKVDLLINDGDDYLENFKVSLIHSLKKHKIYLNNLKHIALISAKTGYGVENLIDVLQLNWGNTGDIYLIGCTNVGKSSLFNALLQSDLCKVKAINLLQRATVSAWPGTTLNLLKFPISKVNHSRLAARSRRIRTMCKEEEALQTCQKLTQNIKLEQVPLQGHIGMTFARQPEISDSPELDELKETKYQGLNPREHDFRKSMWFYDTPGVVNQNQIVHLLTTSELLLTVPKKMLLPRTFTLKPGNSLFIAGLARIDFTNGPGPAWFTVYASMELPLTVTKLEDADYVYQSLLGSPYLRVPMKGKERLSKWPSLYSKKIEISPSPVISEGKLVKEASADVVLSSAGWVCVTVSIGYSYNIEAWTPEGRGIFLRDVPLIRNGHTLRGKKIPDSPAFRNEMVEIQGFSLADDPSY